ncbi:MAG: hypothetical protein CMJ58_13485 [Planctomycetaceae bacterium]|nr:hypothetical protein [Planctomycetaceae bacterium]
MTRGNTRHSAAGNGRRPLRHEALETRALLAVVVGDGPAVCAGETLSAPMAVVKPAADLLMHAEFDPGAAQRTPATDLAVPETLDGPRGRNPGDFDPLPPDDMPWPIPEEVDTSKLGGPGCPLAPPSEGNRTWLGTDEEWADRNDAHDYSCDEGTLTGIPLDPNNLARGDLETAHQAKRNSLGFLIVGPPSSWCDPEPDGKGSGKETGGDDGGKTNVDDKQDDPIVDESSGKPSIVKDSEPEGDDPDELRGALADEALAALGGGGQDAGLSPTGQPQRTTGERGPGLGWRVEQEARPGVEDGGPDELNSPAFAAAIDSALAAGLNTTPPPDDDGNGPYPGPEFSGTQMRGQSMAPAASLAGDSAYPQPDDDGTGPPLPPTA